MAIRMAEAGAMLHEDRLGKMWLLSLEKKKALAQPKSRRAAFFYPRRSCQKYGPRLLTMWHGKRMGDNKHKLKQDRVKLDIKRNFSTVRTVKHCNRGPGWLCNIRSWKLSIASWIKPCPTLSDPRAAPALSSSLD